MTDVADLIGWFAFFAERNGNRAAGSRLYGLAEEWRKADEHHH